MMHSPITRARTPVAMAVPIAIPALVPAVARRWRAAHDRGIPVPARLYRLLAIRHWEMLVPTFDSLMSLCEAALRRPFAAGRGRELTHDEAMLVGLVEGSLGVEGWDDCALGSAGPFESAVRSTRVMIRLVMSAPIGTEA